jgi:hypothetical protein
VDVNFTVQLPVPLLERVMEQFEFAPVILTRPEGVEEPPVTLTLTVTFPLTSDGSGVSAVMVVVVVAGVGPAFPLHKRIVE